MPGRRDRGAAPAGSPGGPDGQNSEPSLAGHMRTVRIVCLGLAVGLALITVGAVAAVRTNVLGAPLADLPEAITWAIGLYVAASLLAARVYSRRGLATIPSSAGKEVVLEHHFRAVIVGMALREGAGVLGAVWGAMLGSLPWLVVLSLPPLLTMVLAWPREGALRDLLPPGSRS